MALPAGRYGVTKNQLLKIKKLPMNTIKLIEELTEKFDLLGSAAFKNSTSVVTDSTDLVESGAVFDVVGWGNKNLFYSPYNSVISGGYTAVKNSDSTFTVNGFDTSQSRALVIGTFTFKAGITYMLSGCPTGISDQIYLRASSNDYTIQKIDNGSGVEISFDTDTTLNIQIRCGVNQTANNLVFSPMIELGDTKTSYEPYHESVEQTLRDAEVVEGKNLLPNNAVNNSINGADFTVNADKSILVNTPVKTTANVFYIIYNSTFPAGSYVLSGCPSGGGNTGYSLRVDGTDLAVRDYGEGASFTLAQPMNVNVRIVLGGSGNLVVTNKLFKPMIRLASDTDDTYEPYYIPLKDVVPNKCDNSVIAPVENGDNASQAYAVGSHFIRDGAFCTVTTAIASGESLVGSSKFTSGDVASELNYNEYNGTFTFNGVLCSYGIKKVGRNVSLYIYMPNVTLTNGSHTLFTLSSEYRPLSYLRVFSGIGISGGDWASSAYYNYGIRVNLNGDVVLCGDDISNIKYVVFSAEYII